MATSITLSTTTYIFQSNTIFYYNTDKSLSGTQLKNNTGISLSNNTSSTQTLQFISDITMTSDYYIYFIISSTNIIIDGYNYNFTSMSLNTYPGLVKNGDLVYNSTSVQEEKSYDYITIKNIKWTDDGNSTCNGGFICGNYYGKLPKISNSYINHCSFNSSNGIIDGNNIYGGIIGNNSCVIANYCYTVINKITCNYFSPFATSSGGGIFGSFSSGTANYCYTIANKITNEITANSGGYGGGGIFAGGSSGTANYCYTIVNTIDNEDNNTYGGGGGGIYGANSYGIANYCYTITDNISSGGGIFGPYSQIGETGATYGGVANYCYVVANNGANIFGYDSTDYKVNNCETGTSWSTISASNTISYTSSSNWTNTDLANNATPYLLSGFNDTLYSPNSYSTYTLPYTSNSGTISTGNYLLISVNDTLSSNISINSTNGILTFDSSLSTTVYQENVLNYTKSGILTVGTNNVTYYYGYNINTFTLNIFYYTAFAFKFNYVAYNIINTFSQDDFNKIMTNILFRAEWATSSTNLVYVNSNKVLSNWNIDDATKLIANHLLQAMIYYNFNQIYLIKLLNSLMVTNEERTITIESTIQPLQNQTVLSSTYIENIYTYMIDYLLSGTFNDSDGNYPSSLSLNTIINILNNLNLTNYAVSIFIPMYEYYIPIVSNLKITLTNNNNPTITWDAPSSSQTYQCDIYGNDSNYVIEEYLVTITSNINGNASNIYTTQNTYLNNYNLTNNSIGCITVNINTVMSIPISNGKYSNQSSSTTLTNTTSYLNTTSNSQYSYIIPKNL